MVWIYRLVLWILDGLLPLAAFFSPRLASFVKGRKGLYTNLQKFRESHEGELVWIHVASLGEFEQAKPLIHLWKRKQPETNILVTFFSPSGYDPVVKRKDQDLDGVVYLPLDRVSHVRKFLDIVRPNLVFFVKYDLWYQFLNEISHRKIPLYLISASFREDQVYFKRKGFFRKPLFFFDHIFTQNEKSGELLYKIGFTDFTRVGDTRFDRVAAIANSPQDFPRIKSWIGNKKTIVLGSVWEEDMEILIPLINSLPDYCWLIAPHSMNPEPLEKWKAKINLPSQFYTSWDSTKSSSVLFINTIGMLSSLYQFAYIAYVGGAFGSGLHNILEPIGFGVPVVFGKVKKAGKFPEALEAIEKGCGFEVKDQKELAGVFERLSSLDFHSHSQKAARDWVQSNLGAAEKIYELTRKLQ
ncbi:3-deoxy-D-manno-octulosonic acid transferase [Algoriphagus limi]|uniref:3-deoxy-D-manno-octulosonic acid transferase n=1 Tax=Algoriphagus limi TaxID=2975273 RepID=A0ABT2G5H7_9BACT|nr:glycosyltransferase N-terminal domain-containing protein [Algoriphagus limi]MCS5490515.1 3-deoxy-D-manno-octulosonic acid transferase [Algoriphagus limi]